MIREKNGRLNGEYNFSAAGFGEIEEANVEVLNDSTLTSKLIRREYSQKDQILQNKGKNLRYRILRNELLK